MKNKLCVENNIYFSYTGKRLDMRGLRTASGAITDKDTEDLVSALDDYRSFGINTITVFCQGSNGGYCQAFAPNGRSMDRNIENRLEKIINAAEEKDMVVVVGIFYQRSDWLESDNAYMRATELIAKKMRDKPNVAINIANEHNSAHWNGCPYAIQNPDELVNLCAVVKNTVPELLVGAGGYDTKKNLQIVKSDFVDVLWFDDQEYHVTMQQYKDNNAAKPHVNVEIFGQSSFGVATLQDGTVIQGVWPDKVNSQARGKQEFYNGISTARNNDGFYLFGHFQAWMQGKSYGLDNRYDVAGYGTIDDPGIRWYLEAVRKA